MALRVEQFDPVADRGSACTVEMGLTTDIGRHNDLGVAALQCSEFLVAQLSGQLGLGQRISPRRTAAQVAVGNRCQVEPDSGQQGFNRPSELLGVLQGARAVERQALIAVYAKRFQGLIVQYFNQVPGQRADPFCLAGISRIAAEQVAIILDEGATTAGSLHNGLGSVFNAGPPCIDVTAGAIKARRLGVEMIIHGAAATGFTGRLHTDPQPVQNSGGRRVGIR